MLAVAVDGVTLLATARLTYQFQRFAVPFSSDAEGKTDIALQYGVAGPQAVLHKTRMVQAQ